MDTTEMLIEIQQAQFAFNTLKLLVERDSVLVPTQIIILEGKISHLIDCWGYRDEKLEKEYNDLLTSYNLSLEPHLKEVKLHLKEYQHN